MEVGGIAWLQDAMSAVTVPFGTLDWAWWMTLGFVLWVASGTFYSLVILPRTSRARENSASKQVPQKVEAPVAPAGDAEAPTETTAAPAAVQEAKAPPKKAPRAEYLDALKAFMTFLVVFHHVVRTFEQDNWYPFNIYACRDLTKTLDAENCRGHFFKNVFVDWTTAINTSYFMNLFFLISGYFTPSSLDRKGIQAFLADKFKRLGLPALAWFLLFGPLLWYMCLAPIFGTSFSYGDNGSWIARGPPWFVAWLLTFNVVYAMSDGAPIVMPMPRVGALLMMGLVMGVLLNVSPTNPIMAIPAGVQELIVNFVFFAGGIVAKRNGWLEQVEAMPMRTVWLLRALAGVLLLASFALKLLGHYEPENLRLYNRQMSNIFLKGLFTVVITFVELDFFRRNFQVIGRFMRFLADASYAVFLIHPYVTTLVAWGFVEMIKACGVEVIKADLVQAGLAKSSYAPVYAFVIESEGEGLLWACFAFTLVLTTVVVWPFSEGVRRLPGFREVL
eukprot:TRINITY_DN6530_c0_g2_i1.p1 TRINITY_DN6530_c0_g2~~TRINITY_DN6530_c0_g2_i1.p1  ORF type:complete len:503 (-),score=89.63 TRINITY_DN6530_c0_g2_i1:282-1790(-)